MIVFRVHRKQLKIIFDNLAQLDRTYMIMEVQNRMNYTTHNWREMSFDVSTIVDLMSMSIYVKN